MSESTEIFYEDTEVSVVLPCLNEEARIAICLSKIQQVFAHEHIKRETVVVDSRTQV